MEAFFSTQIFLILQFSFEGKTEYLLITKEAMLTLREQTAHSQGGSMTLCPIALMATCNKCPAVGICPLKEVLGDHKPENPASAANDPSVKDKTANL
jgi:hypothetical protein